MSLEKILCPQCGGNTFHPFGMNGFKCDFCGCVFREEEDKKMEAKPPAFEEHIVPSQQNNEHYVAPLNEFASDQEVENYEKLPQNPLQVIFWALAAVITIGVLAIVLSR